jgi:SAM-dependent methyltransferase
MKETSKTRRIWTAAELAILQGSGIDIGCGSDCVTRNARRFDMEDGDANEITRFIPERFDFVYSSHCLEHMREPRKAILEWWRLVKPGGHLMFIVPDEDLYEQGVFPSRFNPDHKATFTIAKRSSWSGVSLNVLDLARSLPNGHLVALELQDHQYDRRLYKFGPVPPLGRLMATTRRLYRGIQRRTSIDIAFLDRMLEKREAVDQTLRPDVLAQIQCIVKKVAVEEDVLPAAYARGHRP